MRVLCLESLFLKRLAEFYSLWICDSSGIPAWILREADLNFLSPTTEGEGYPSRRTELVLVNQVSSSPLILGSLGTPTLSPKFGDVFQHFLLLTQPGSAWWLSGTPSCSLSPLTLEQPQALWQSFCAVDSPFSDSLLQSAIVFQGLLQISCSQMSLFLVFWQSCWWECSLVPSTWKSV